MPKALLLNLKVIRLIVELLKDKNSEVRESARSCLVLQRPKDPAVLARIKALDPATYREIVNPDGAI